MVGGEVEVSRGSYQAVGRLGCLGLGSLHPLERAGLLLMDHRGGDLRRSEGEASLQTGK